MTTPASTAAATTPATTHTHCGGRGQPPNSATSSDGITQPSPHPRRRPLELWARDSEHKSRVSSRGLEPCSGDVVIDVVVVAPPPRGGWWASAWTTRAEQGHGGEAEATLPG